MLKRNLFDEAARVLAMPIPRRKAFKYVATGFAGALLSFLWPKRARATEHLPYCGNCPGCTNDSACNAKLAHSACTTVGGQRGYCNPIANCIGCGGRCLVDCCRCT
jgi:hypothetical protein